MESFRNIGLGWRIIKRGDLKHLNSKSSTKTVKIKTYFFYKKVILFLRYAMQMFLDDSSRSRSNLTRFSSILLNKYLWPDISTFLSNRTSDGRTFHFTLWVHDDTSIVFKVEVDTILASPCLSLTNNNSRMN
jgi:hypothetical protein